MKKGYVYTVEAAIAISIILVAVVLILASQKASQPLSTALIKEQAFNALRFMDQNGELRPLVAGGNTNAIRDKLKTYLLPTINFDVELCNAGCTADLPSGKNVVAIDYYVAGYRTRFMDQRVRVWLWGSF